jgi:hypothetical protein
LVVQLAHGLPNLFSACIWSGAERFALALERSHPARAKVRALRLVEQLGYVFEDASAQRTEE